MNVNMIKTNVPLETATYCCTPVASETVNTRQARQLASTFAALADPTRLRLLSLIATAKGEVCACEFVTTLRKSQPTISHHLKVLRDAGLIKSKRRGKWQWYSVVPERLKQLRRTLS